MPGRTRPTSVVLAAFMSGRFFSARLRPGEIALICGLDPSPFGPGGREAEGGRPPSSRGEPVAGAHTHLDPSITLAVVQSQSVLHSPPPLSAGAHPFLCALLALLLLPLLLLPPCCCCCLRLLPPAPSKAAFPSSQPPHHRRPTLLVVLAVLAILIVSTGSHHPPCPLAVARFSFSNPISDSATFDPRSLSTHHPPFHQRRRSTRPAIVCSASDLSHPPHEG
jgi:hypothetical protein